VPLGERVGMGVGERLVPAEGVGVELPEEVGVVEGEGVEEGVVAPVGEALAVDERVGVRVRVGVGVREGEGVSAGVDVCEPREAEMVVVRVLVRVREVVGLRVEEITLPTMSKPRDLLFTTQTLGVFE
jgi:hypothetical protein